MKYVSQDQQNIKKRKNCICAFRQILYIYLHYIYIYISLGYSNVTKLKDLSKTGLITIFSFRLGHLILQKIFGLQPLILISETLLQHFD